VIRHSAPHTSKSPADPAPPPSLSTAACEKVDTAEVGVLMAVWCCSVGTTWTLELRELGRDGVLGTTIDWISSGVPIAHPAPEALVHELLAARGLRLSGDSPAGPPTRSRYPIGYAYPDTAPTGAAEARRSHGSDPDRGSTSGPLQSRSL
jgi:hypothetical protein